MKKIILIILLFIIISPKTVFAIPGIDLEASIGYNPLTPEGKVEYTKNGGTGKLDLKETLDLKKNGNVRAYFIFDIPLIPTIKIEYAPLKFNGEKSSVGLPAGTQFGSLPITAGNTIKTELDFMQLDTSLYYSIPLPYIKPRFGLAVKYLNGSASLTSIVTAAGQNIETTEEADTGSLPIPMAYLGLSVAVPLASYLPGIEELIFDIEVKGIGTGENLLLSDLNLSTQISFLKIPLFGSMFIGGGYKRINLNVQSILGNDLDFKSDIVFSGIYGQIGVKF